MWEVHPFFALSSLTYLHLLGAQIARIHPTGQLGQQRPVGPVEERRALPRVRSCPVSPWLCARAALGREQLCLVSLVSLINITHSWYFDPGALVMLLGLLAYTQVTGVVFQT